jgi:uncharacterized protein YndB with AHSA1/START domain
MENTTVTKDLENKTLIIEYVFDAPKEQIWRAFADKAWFEKWWGPEGWETTTKTFDFRPGGTIHYCMKCVDENQGEFFGQEAWGVMHIENVDEPNSFSATDYFSDASGEPDNDMPTQKFVVELVSEDGGTRLIDRNTSETVEQMEEVIKMGMIEGYSSQLQKLQRLLAEQ